MKKISLCAVMLVFGMVGSASADLITNGNFDSGFTGWTANGDVRIANTSDPLGAFAAAQGMDGAYALLGLDSTDGNSTLRQDFEIVGLDEITISFNWAFDYWDNSASAEDTFISFVRQDEKPALKISLLDLQTNGTAWYDVDLGLAHGFFTDTIDISAFTTDEARMIFRLVEESDSNWYSGTASVAGIDNVSITGTAPVPEPSTMLLMGAGLLGLVGYNRKRSKK